MIPIGKLTKIDLRTLWKGEASDFTPWLAQEENIKILGEAVNMELEVETMEEKVGLFRADILCKETMTDQFVLIENQLERTDHSHLGQLLTYAAGLNAVSIIWVAKEFTEEHRATLDWLNSITSDHINFFGIEVELYKIGDSLPAPMFNVISKPNDWSKSIRKSAESTPVSGTKLLQQEYWLAFKRYLESTKSILRSQKAQPWHWHTISIGRSGVHLEAIINTRDNTNRAELSLNGTEAKQWFGTLKEQYEADATNALGQLTWEELPDSKMSRVYLKNSADLYSKESWEDQFKWLKVSLEKMYNYFAPKVKAL